MCTLAIGGSADYVDKGATGCTQYDDEQQSSPITWCSYQIGTIPWQSQNPDNRRVPPKQGDQVLQPGAKGITSNGMAH